MSRSALLKLPYLQRNSAQPPLANRLRFSWLRAVNLQDYLNPAKRIIFDFVFVGASIFQNVFHGRFLRRENSLLQNGAILRNAMRMSNGQITQRTRCCATLWKPAQNFILELQNSMRKRQKYSSCTPDRASYRQQNYGRPLNLLTNRMRFGAFSCLSVPEQKFC